MAPAIEVVDVSKRFRLVREKPTSLKARVLSGRTRTDDFWALRDVSFEVDTGETLALIGHNGSGKSTLLKVIAGILRPTQGLVRQRGRIAALLELGAGFHQELTGRENVYLNASFLGLSRRDTDRVYDEIVRFAELGEFMEMQVKFYSSGMLVRLGFAVAVHVDPEILLIDEVLAVGDEAFQSRCLDRVRTFQREGRTIVLVTHALDQVRQLCDRAVMLDHGVVATMGDPHDVVRAMRLTILSHDLEFAHEEGSKEVEILAAQLIRADDPLDGALHPGEILTLQVDLKANERVQDPVVSFAFHDAANNFIFGSDTVRAGVDSGRARGEAAPALRRRSRSVHRGEVLGDHRRPLARQPARLPPAGPAVLVRGAADRGTPRPELHARPRRRGGTVNEPTGPLAPDTGTVAMRERSRKEGGRRMLIGLILFSVTLAAAAQITLKSGVDRVTDAQGGELRFGADGFKALAASPFVWAGLVLFAISAVAWLFALSKASLSFAYPFAALGYVLIVAFSAFVLHESVPVLRWVGVVFIVIGIVFVAQTPHA